MPRTYTLGVDLGTTGTKTAIYDTDGNLAAEAYEESRLRYPKPGWVEQDPDDIYGSAVRTIKACLAKSGLDAGLIACLAFDGQMAGVGTIDADWNAPTRYDSWLDTRCSAYIPALKQQEHLVISRSGGPPSISHGAKILWWMHEAPEVYRRVAKFVVPGAYVAGRMAGLRGEEAFIDHTYLHFTCFADSAGKDWSDELLDLFEVDRRVLPRIIEPSEIIGRVTKAAAHASGLKEGTPIAAGCGDQAAGMLGAAMVRPGLVFDVAGTASVFAACVNAFVTDQANRTLFTASLPIPGLYYALAYINGGGLNLRWFRDELVPHERARAQAEGTSIYALLDREASEILPGSNSLLFLPHLGGRVCPSEANARGAYVGLNWSHTRAHLYRAMLEAVGYEYAYYLSIVRSLLPNLDLREVRAIGGGATSGLWNRIKADILGVPCVRLNRQEFSAFGSALLAGHAVGLYLDLAATASGLTHSTDRVDPDMGRHRQYQFLAGEYMRLNEAMRPVFDALAALPQAT